MTSLLKRSPFRRGGVKAPGARQGSHWGIQTHEILRRCYPPGLMTFDTERSNQVSITH